MLVNFTRVVLVAGGSAGSYQLLQNLRSYWGEDYTAWVSATLLAVFMAAGLGYVIGGVSGRWLNRMVFRLETALHSHSSADVFVGFIGMVMGLALAALVSISIRGIDIVGAYLPPLVFVVLGFLGVRIATRRKEEFLRALPFVRRDGPEPGTPGARPVPPKIIDTSAVIDGRLVDIYRAGFFEGDLVVPTFVLVELQALADSHDSLKRAKGRRGLDLLSELQHENGAPVSIFEKEVTPGGVDQGLVKLAKQLEGAVVTKDFNLEKVAALSGVRVLNVGALAAAMKSVVASGESLHLNVVRPGKEEGQGLAYLEDGTMVVIEGGRGLVGESIDAVVTSVLQTASGRMLFAKPVSGGHSGAPH